jgi:hypothetical protein
MTPAERQIRLAASLIVLGLLIELGSLSWKHPTAFLLFAIAGGAALLTGFGVYLHWLILRRDVAARGAP